MGGLTSKHVDEAINPNSEEVNNTPKPNKTHILSIDPRSPSESISRTPIAVPNTPDPNNGTPVTRKSVKTLATDPRSPSGEVNRTPIQIESKDTRRRPNLPVRPIRLTTLDSMNDNEGKTNTCDSEDNDPRSPTCKVPRTPLCNKEHDFRASEIVEQESTSTEKEPELSAEKKTLVADGTNDKVRRPLSIVLNSGSNTTPRGIIQAKQCRNVEEEYNKNQKVLLNQLPGQENKVASNTQFIETI